MNIRLGHLFGIGDSLWITPIYKEFKDTTTILYDTERNKRMAFFFEGLTKIEFEKEEVPPLDYHYELFKSYGKISENEFLYWKKYDPIHLSTKLFKYLGVDENKHSVIPFINASQECLDLGQNLLSKIGKINNPLIIVANNSGGIFEKEDQNNWQAAYRTLSPEIWQEIINEYSKKHTILQCGKKGRVFKFKNVIPMYEYFSEYNNELKVITGLYHLIKKYLGVNTGDYNLMLSLGGECKVLVPEFNSWFNGVSSIFKEKDFKEEKIRTEYINFRDALNFNAKKILSF